MHRGAVRAFVAASSLVAALGWLSPPTVRAQPAPGSPGGEPASASIVASARAAFSEGVAATERGEWEQARQSFERAYALVREPLILFNLAGAQSQTGHLVAAAASYHRFIDQAIGAAAEHVDEARSALAGVEARIAHARVRAPNLAPGDVVQLDDRELARASVRERLPVDPGSHELVVLRDGRTIGRASFRVTEGAEREVALAVPRRPRAVRVVHETTTVWESPVFWTIVGVVLVGAGVTVGVVATQGSTQEPYTGTLGRVPFP